MTLCPKKHGYDHGILLNGKDREQLKCLEVKLSVLKGNGQVKPKNVVRIVMPTECYGDAIVTSKLYVRLNDNYGRHRDTRENLWIRCVIHMEQKIEIPTMKSDLGRDLSKIMDWKQFTDFKTHCGEKTFDCNKAILAARRNVFKTMFEQDMLKSKMGVVLVKDVKPEVMEQVLRFIYTDKVDDFAFEELATELVDAANKYELKGLKKLYMTFLGASIEDNACDLLTFAKLYSLEDLKIKIISFFKNVDSCAVKPVLRSVGQQLIQFTKELF